MLQVIYIPGLSDKRVTFQRLAVKLWRIWGVQPQLFHVRWGDGESFDTKFVRLLTVIDEAAQRGSVALVGSSAGATAVITAMAARPHEVRAAVCIAGKINNPQTVNEGYKQLAPAFWQAVQRTPEALNELSSMQRSTILSLQAMVDLIVPRQDSIVPGAENRPVWTSGHAFTIGWQLVVGAPFFLHFLKVKATTSSHQN